MINRKKCNFYKQKAKMDVRVRTKYICRKWLRELPLQISYVAINLLAEQYNFAIAALDLPINRLLWPCTDYFGSNMPCLVVNLFV